MPPKVEFATSTLMIKVHINQYSGKQNMQVNIVFQIPKQNPVSTPLYEIPRPPSTQSIAEKTKKPSAQPNKIDPKAQLQNEQQQLNQLKFLTDIQQEIPISNPDDLQQVFISEQLKLSLEDPNSKQTKQQQQNQQFQTVDISPLLVNLHVNEDHLVCTLQPDFKITFSIEIYVIKSTYQFTSFLNPNTLLTPFIFQVVDFAQIPQYKDPFYRKKYYKPVKVTVKLFGQLFTSEAINQEMLGTNAESVSVPVRINCNFLCKTEQELSQLRKKLDEDEAEITVYSRVNINEDYDFTEDNQKQKQKQQDPDQQTKFIKVRAVAKLPLRLLVLEREIDTELHLYPKYELLGKNSVPNCKQLFNQQQSRVPKFQASQPPPTDPKELVKYQAEKQKNPQYGQGLQTEFSSFQPMPDALPVGNWENAYIHVRAAVLKPIEQLIKQNESKEQTKQSQQPSQLGKQSQLSRPGSQAQLNIKQQQSGRLTGKSEKDSKQDLKYFERMYIYLDMNQVPECKQILKYVAQHNVEVIKKMGIDKVKAQYAECNATNMDDFISLLATQDIAYMLRGPRAVTGKGQQKVIDAAQPQTTYDVQSLEIPAITGFFFIDRNINLFFLEAPAFASAFDNLRSSLITKFSKSCESKIGPSVQFYSRAFPNSSLILNQLALHKPLYQLSMKFEQTVHYLQPLLKLFHIDPEQKDHMLQPVPSELRAMKAAGLFISEHEYEQIIKFYGGSIPTHLRLEQLFPPPAAQSTPQSKKSQTRKSSTRQIQVSQKVEPVKGLDKEDKKPVTQDSKVSKTESVKVRFDEKALEKQKLQQQQINFEEAFKQQDNEKLLVQAPKITIRHYQLKQTDSPQQIPQSLINVMNQDVELKKELRSEKSLPMLQATQRTSVQKTEKKLDKSDNEDVKFSHVEVVNDILNGTNLKSSSKVQQAVTGKEVFMYSQQTLNKQRIRNRIFDKENEKVLHHDVHVDNVAFDKTSAGYQKERGWK